MKKIEKTYFVLGIFIFLSLTVKLILIFKYQNQLTLDSDDINYIKSAVVLLEKGIFVFHNYNEPTVFVMPLYPLFLAGIFKMFGYGLTGLQIARVLQAIFSCVTIFIVFLISRELFCRAAYQSKIRPGSSLKNDNIGLVAAFIVSFYIPNIVTSGYLLTETLFTTTLCLLIYLSLRFSHSYSNIKFALLGIIWAAATLLRPTIAMYPVMLFVYIYLYFRVSIRKIIPLGASMLLSFIVIMSPWWVRNYLEYGDFIPLSAASGNPMLQGTYVNYEQTPENMTYYELGENSYETNKIEIETAKKRIISELDRDFWRYIRWYTLGKTYMFWGTIFYWKEFLGIRQQIVLVFHYFILLGFAGIVILIPKNFLKYMLPVSLILYFNFTHCMYMAFDRYALPVIPILSIFCAFFVIRMARFLRKFLR